MNEPEQLSELRRLVVDTHGLPLKAATFLSGSTLTELDESATKLAGLIGVVREHEPAAGPAGRLFTHISAEKAQRKAALAAIFTGRAAQSRDEAGRYTRAAVIYGGAREPVWPKRSPEVKHNEMLVELLKTRRADAGIYFGSL